MNQASILTVIDGDEPSRNCVERALVLATALQARVHILLWRDWSPAISKLRPRTTQHAMEYLNALQKALSGRGVAITTQVTFGGSLGQIIPEQISHQNSVMVVKLRRHGVSGLVSSADRELLQQSLRCPLLFTDGQPWSPQPRFVAAINVPEVCLGRDTSIIQPTAALQRAFAASLDLVYAEPCDATPEPAEGESSSLVLLRRMAHRCRVEPQHFEILEGTARQALPRFVSAMRYDLLAIGRPTEKSQGRWPFLAPTLAESLMQIDCDLLVVNDDQGQMEVALARAAHTSYMAPGSAETSRISDQRELPQRQ